jgi:hypothetical protein
MCPAPSMNVSLALVDKCDERACIGESANGLRSPCFSNFLAIMSEKGVRAVLFRGSRVLSTAPRRPSNKFRRGPPAVELAQAT